MVLSASAVVLAAGCAATPLVPPTREVALISETMACADPLLDPPTPGAGVVPDDFEPVAVLECVSGATREDAEGVVSGTEVLRYEGDLSALLEAMAAPSDPGPAAVCPAMMYGFRVLWATDAAGRFVPLSFPSTACGGPKEDAALAALARLEVTDRAFTAVARVELHEAAATGCATRAAVAPIHLLDWLPDDGGGDASPPSTAVPERDAVADGIALVPWQPQTAPPLDELDGAQVCVYRADAPDAGGGPAVVGEGGLFAAAYPLDAASTRDVFTAAAAPPLASDCAETASRFVVVHPRTASAAGGAAPLVTVELDGCRRIVGTDLQARPAPPDLIALLSR